MILLSTAIRLLDQTLQVLNDAGPPRPPAHLHWQEARVHLTAARRELERVVELSRAPQPEA